MTNEVTTYDPVGALEEFNSAYGVRPFIEEDAFGRDRLLDLRMRLIEEEFREVMDELLDAKNGQGNMARLAKELADLKYVIYGTETLLDIPSYEVFNEVHASNMSKLGPDGRPVRREDGKIMKGPNYRPANIETLFGVSD